MWGDYPAAYPSKVRHDFGDASLHLRFERGRGAIQRMDFAVTASRKRAGTPGIQWTGLYLDGSTDAYTLAPAFPETPSLIALDPPVVIAPGAEIEAFVAARAEVEIGAGPGVVLRAVSLSPPCKALFGSLESGLVCRSYRSPVLASEDDAPRGDPSVILHPVRIRNSGDSTTAIASLCLHTNQLGIYLVEGRLVTERMDFVLSDRGIRSFVESHSARPSKGSRLLAHARKSPEEYVFDRSMEFLKTLARIST